LIDIIERKISWEGGGAERPAVGDQSGSDSGGARFLDVDEAEAAVVQLRSHVEQIGRRQRGLALVEVDADSERPHRRHHRGRRRGHDAVERVAAQPVLSSEDGRLGKTKQKKNKNKKQKKHGHADTWQIVPRLWMARPLSEAHGIVNQSDVQAGPTYAEHQ